jgi:hypothetical protein
MPDPISRLTDINLDDLVSSFGLENNPRLAKALRAVFHSSAQKFARQMVEFDQLVGAKDLPTAARQLLKNYVQDVRVFGQGNIPAQGPILVLSNHPGMTDTICLFAAINRTDLRIIALNRPFLQSLPNTTNHLFYISDNAAERMGAVKKAASHLRNGGAVLTFPAGKIEPDPDVYSGARESLSNWLDSAGVFVRFAPETWIIPALVRNVLWDKAVKHPLTHFKKDRMEREKLGAAFQLLSLIMFDVHPNTVDIQFGKPLTLSEIGSTEIPAIHAAVIERIQVLVDNPPVEEGKSAI